MKVGQIQIDSQEDGCKLCAVHQELTSLHPDEVECSWCGEWMPVGFTDIRPVGETNSIDELEEEITNGTVWQCSKCQKWTALLPTKITWNANHDVYYTGGKAYLPDIDVVLDKSIDQKIDNYTSRILAGEQGLRSWNLRGWMQYAIEAAVAKALYDIGYKR